MSIIQTDPQTCLDCNGTGYIESEICLVCSGTGGVPVKGTTRYLKKRLDDIEDKCDDIMDKCNNIFEKVNE